MGAPRLARRKTPCRAGSVPLLTGLPSIPIPGPEYHSLNPVPLISCMTLEEIFNFSKPQFHFQLNRGNNSTHHTQSYWVD